MMMMTELIPYFLDSFFGHQRQRQILSKLSTIVSLLYHHLQYNPYVPTNISSPIDHFVQQIPIHLFKTIQSTISPSLTIKQIQQLNIGFTMTRQLSQSWKQELHSQIS